MGEKEIRDALKEKAREPQLFRIESNDPARIVFGFVVRFPHDRMLRVVEEIPSVRHVIDPKRAVYYTAHVRNRLMENHINGDAAAVNWTNWVSMTAAIRALILQFNNAQAKRAQAADPVREAVAAAHARKH